MAITSCSQLVLLVFASAAIMEMLLVKAEICNESIGSCQGIDCNKACGDKHPGGSGTCDSTNTCKCYFDCPPKKKCNAGLGLCSVEGCNEQCCAQNCASKYTEGVGYCNMLGSTWLCQCQYTCS